MEKLELDVLDLLASDSRYSNKKIATMLGEKEEIIDKTIKKLEKSGVIVKYTTIVNSEKVSKTDVEALIEVRVAPQKRLGFDAIAREIYAFEEVKSVYLMSGGYDLCVVICGKSLREVASFVSDKLSTIDTVLSTATHFILKKYKQDGTIIDGGDQPNRVVVSP